MDDKNLKLLWQSANKNIESCITINKKNTEEITRLKVQNFLSSMKPLKIFSLIVGIIWVVGMGILLINLFLSAYEKVSLFFLYSAAIQVIISAIAIVVYIYQIDIIYKIDFSKPIIIIQEKLSRLRVSTLNVTRILFLQLPLWTIFYWNETMFENENVTLWVFQGIITLLLTYLAFWLFFNIKYENRNKRWFRVIFRGREWQPILQSMELLNQIEDYQDEKSKKLDLNK